jgi:hypothetical protein
LIAHPSTSLSHYRQPNPTEQNKQPQNVSKHKHVHTAANHTASGGRRTRVIHVQGAARQQKDRGKKDRRQKDRTQANPHARIGARRGLLTAATIAATRAATITRGPRLRRAITITITRRRRTTITRSVATTTRVLAITISRS